MLSEPYQLSDGRIVIITLDECEPTAHVKTSEGQDIGRLEFYVVEDPNGECLKLAWAYLDFIDGYKRKGIGRECVRRVSDLFGLPVIAGENDGHRQDDGSHLTGDAPAFVHALRREELIAPSSSYRYDRPDED